VKFFFQEKVLEELPNRSYVFSTIQEKKLMAKITGNLYGRGGKNTWTATLVTR